MRELLDKALVTLGWILIAGAVLLGVWILLDLLTGGHEIFGGPTFALRSLLTSAVTIAVPLGLGVGLLALADLRASRS